MVHDVISLLGWDSIESVRAIHSSLEGWALVFFALLVMFDVLAHLTDEESNRARAKRFDRVGLWCFGIAIVAEIIAWPYGQRNDKLSILENKAQADQIRELDRSLTDAKLDLATKQSGLDIKVEQERQKTAGFEKQATLARLELAKELRRVDDNDRRRSPRWMLLRDAKPGDDPRLKPFIGQLIYIFDCEGRADRLAPRDEETVTTSLTLGNELYAVAHWQVRVDQRICSAQPPESGLDIIVSPRANSGTNAAAEALASVIRDALLISPNDELAMRPVRRIELSTPTLPRDPTDPNTIILKVSAHPLR
jgi:hypothetical protein